MEFRGAIDDEADCYNGGTAWIHLDKLIDGPNFVGTKQIDAIWCKDNIPWQYETDIPHETFDVLEDGEIYCKGIVFRIEDLK